MSEFGFGRNPGDMDRSDRDPEEILAQFKNIHERGVALTQGWMTLMSASVEFEHYSACLFMTGPESDRARAYQSMMFAAVVAKLAHMGTTSALADVCANLRITEFEAYSRDLPRPDWLPREA